MGSEPLPRESHGTLNQGSSRGLGFPKCKRKSCTWLQDRYGAQIPAEILNDTVVCSHPPVKQLPPSAGSLYFDLPKNQARTRCLAPGQTEASLGQGRFILNPPPLVLAFPGPSWSGVSHA